MCQKFVENQCVDSCIPEENNSLIVNVITKAEDYDLRIECTYGFPKCVIHQAEIKGEERKSKN